MTTPMATGALAVSSRDSSETKVESRPASEAPLRRHVLTDEDRARSRTPEALEKARQTKRMRAEARREYARMSYEAGYSIAKIADDLGLSDSTVEGMVAGSSRYRYGRGVIHPDPNSPLAR